MLRNSRVRLALATIGLLGFGVCAGYAVGTARDAGSSFSLTLANTTQYPFMHPLVGIKTPESYGASTLAPLRAAVTSVAKDEPAGAVTRYSFYFRDLTNAMWTGINENDQYNPASMLKVAAALAVYKQNELTPGFLSQRLVYTQELKNLNDALPFALPVNLKIGQSYSVPFLLQQMLSDSDNGAKDLLLSSISQKALDNTYVELSIPKPDDTNSAGYTISPIDYSRFLRVLFYGSYDISWNDSNSMLKLLSEATFTNGLVAGVPNTVPVAHKYGEHIIEADSHTAANGVELSDCGIVYHPTDPYLICVMTEGKDPLVLADFIAKVSKAAYVDVDARAQ